MEDIFLDKINKAFRGKPVLKDLSARFPAGKVSCIMAPSGAGKTTLLRILMGLEKPDSGMVKGMEGKRLAAVFQEDRLCPWMTAMDNIRLVSPALPREEALAALREMDLEPCADQSVRELSGGMQRRVSLLRALLAEYDVLLLDEPFKGLDKDTKTAVIDTARRRSTGKTVLLVTHDATEGTAMGAAQMIKICS